MSLEDAQAYMQERRLEHSVAFDVACIGGLAFAVHELQIIRNDKRGLTEEQAAQRQALLDIVIRIVRNKIKKMAREELLPTLEQWEKM